MFGKATIRLGIGPHSSCNCNQTNYGASVYCSCKCDVICIVVDIFRLLITSDTFVGHSVFTTICLFDCLLVGWRRGVVDSVVRRMNEVTLCLARLVLRWVTVFGRVYHHGM